MESEAADAALRCEVEADRRPFYTRGWELLARGAGYGRASSSRERLHGGLRPAPPSPPTEQCSRIAGVRRHETVQQLGSCGRDSIFLQEAILLNIPCSGGPGRGAERRCTPRLRASAPRRRWSLPEWDRTVDTDPRRVARGCRSDRRQPWRRRRIDFWGLSSLSGEGGDGRRMPHGRHERPLTATALARSMPGASVVLRGEDDSTVARFRCSPEAATRALVRAPTWPASCGGTGLSRRCSPPAPPWPGHPPMVESARPSPAICPASRSRSAGRRDVRLAELLPSRTRSLRERDRASDRRSRGSARAATSASSTAPTRRRSHLRWQGSCWELRPRILLRLRWCCPISTSRTTRRCLRASPSRRETRFGRR